MANLQAFCLCKFYQTVHEYEWLVDGNHCVIKEKNTMQQNHEIKSND